VLVATVRFRIDGRHLAQLDVDIAVLAEKLTQEGDISGRERDGHLVQKRLELVVIVLSSSDPHVVVPGEPRARHSRSRRRR
jgi:hypothetical protein